MTPSSSFSYADAALPSSLHIIVPHCLLAGDIVLLTPLYSCHQAKSEQTVDGYNRCCPLTVTAALQVLWLSMPSPAIAVLLASCHSEQQVARRQRSHADIVASLVLRWFVMGPARSGSGLHMDPLATSAWNALLVGHKRWALFPPGTPRHHVLPKLPGLEREAVSWFTHVYPLTQRDDWPTAKPIDVIQVTAATTPCGIVCMSHFGGLARSLVSSFHPCEHFQGIIGQLPEPTDVIEVIETTVQCRVACI